MTVLTHISSSMFKAVDCIWSHFWTPWLQRSDFEGNRLSTASSSYAGVTAVECDFTHLDDPVTTQRLSILCPEAMSGW